MAPEQLEGGRASAASDTYALGLVIYEMVTGAKPEFQRLTEPAPSPRLKAPELDGNWEAVILRCLERNPAKRFSKATDVAKALRGGVSETRTATLPSSGSAAMDSTRKSATQADCSGRNHALGDRRADGGDRCFTALGYVGHGVSDHQ